MLRKPSSLGLNNNNYQDMFKTKMKSEGGPGGYFKLLWLCGRNSNEIQQGEKGLF